MPTKTIVRERDDLISRLDDLNNELLEIDERRSDIRSQIERAQAKRYETGEWADADWYRRANKALRVLGIDRAEVTREIGEANRRLRRLNAAADRDTFYRATREVVDQTTWDAIVARHIQIQIEEGI